MPDNPGCFTISNAACSDALATRSIVYIFYWILDLIKYSIEHVYNQFNTPTILAIKLITKIIDSCCPNIYMCVCACVCLCKCLSVSVNIIVFQQYFVARLSFSEVCYRGSSNATIAPDWNQWPCSNATKRRLVPANKTILFFEVAVWLLNLRLALFSHVSTQHVRVSGKVIGFTRGSAQRLF